MAESHTMTTAHHAVWTKAELMDFFSDVWGLCGGAGGLRGGSTRHQKSTKLDIHGRKQQPSLKKVNANFTVTDAARGVVIA